MSKPAIIANPELMSGTPCFRGTRVPFKNLIDYLEGGHSLGEFLQQFPTVSRDLTVQALEEAKVITARQNRMRILLVECCHSISGRAFTTMKPTPLSGRVSKTRRT